jgi:hypothetical protein
MEFLPRTPPVVLVYTLATFGLYSVAWTYITWGQIGQYSPGTTGRVPASLHTAGMCLPIVGWFRVAAHARGVNQMLEAGKANSRIRVALVVALTVAAWLLVSPLTVPLVDLLHQEGLPIWRAGLMVYFTGVTMAACAVSYMQSGLTRASKTREIAGTHLGRIEAIVFVLIVLFWLWRIYTLLA